MPLTFRQCHIPGCPGLRLSRPSDLLLHCAHSDELTLPVQLADTCRGAPEVKGRQKCTEDDSKNIPELGLACRHSRHSALVDFHMYLLLPLQRMYP